MLRENIRPTEAEQEAWYETLAKVSSESLAFFYCRISFDLPFELEAIPRDDPSSPWLAYLDNPAHQKTGCGEGRGSLWVPGWADGYHENLRESEKRGVQ